MLTDSEDELNSTLVRPEYTVDTRPLCQGMPFLLTDAAHPRLVLKYGSQFLVLNEAALIPGCNTLGYGYYRFDTRHISQWDMALKDVPLSILSKSVNEGYAGTFLYTNPQTDSIPQQKLTVQREIVLSDLLWEKLTVQNFHNEIINCELKFTFQSDFADIFEVRGYNPPKRGQRMRPVAGKNGRSLFLAYEGLDNSLTETVIEFFGLRPSSFNESEGEIYFDLSVSPHSSEEFQICVSTQFNGELVPREASKTGYASQRKLSDERYQEWSRRRVSIQTGHELFNLSVERSFRDIYMLRQPTPKGYGLSAGIPWYCAVFGRDSAITSWQILPVMPEVARECIEVLAAYQGTEINDYKDEQPGRIMHELRLGEQARTGQVPHSPYYGTVDATQMWLYVLAQYTDWSADIELANKLWPAVTNALNWLDSSLVNGYLTYFSKSEKGLVNQGWKDSFDSIMHADGTLAKPPLALCEPQAYLYACWIEIAKLANRLGHNATAEKLRTNAQSLKERFQKDFWVKEEQYLALALDSHWKPVKVISSNPGQCLFADILDEEKANAVADRLMAEDLHSGWGVRTLAKSSVAYNPVSYHNGSVWPHDNAIIAEGMRKIGRPRDAHTIMASLLQVAQFEPEFRLPELVCGFDRNGSYRPIDYPVSCSPQAWSAGSIFQLIKACVNLKPNAYNNTLSVIDPALPEWLPRLTMRGIRVGSATIDLCFTTENGITSCQVLHKYGKVRVVIES